MPLQFLHSCIKNTWYYFQWSFILQDPVTLSDINTPSLLKAERYLWKDVLLAVCWDLKCFSKANLSMFSASFTIPVQPAATPDPSMQWKGCSALWWLGGQAQPPQPGLSYKASGLPLPWWCPSGVPCCSQSERGLGVGLSQALTPLGNGLSGSGDWLYLIWEKAKPAVIGPCRGTAVLLITCIKKCMKINWNMVYNWPQLWLLGSTVATCWLVPSPALAAKEDWTPSLF